MQENILLQISDSITAFSYFLLPAILLLHNYRFNALGGKNILALGIAFIFSCGLGHLMHALNAPIAVLVTQNTITASISIITAITIYQILPQLLTNGELLKEIQNNSPDGVVALQAVRVSGKIFDLKWIYVNPAATQILGRTDLLGKLHNEEYGESTEAYHLLEHYIEVLETGKTYNNELFFSGNNLDKWIWFQAIRLNSEQILVNFRDVSHLKKLTIKDDLTGLFNSRYLNSLTSRNFDGILFIDLDRFKIINDTAGHQTGDAILQTVAQRISQSIKDDDIAIRNGGDEFLVLLSKQSGNSQHKIAQLVANRILSSIEQPIDVEESSYSISCSIGIAENVEHKVKLSELKRRGDIAMYVSKKSKDQSLSKPKVTFYSIQQDESLQAEEEIRRELISAIKNKEFCLWYQRVVDLKSPQLSVIGFEALIRWNHPDKGLIFPNQFIPIAEQFGLSSQISQFVLEESYRQVVQWSTPNQPFKMSINLSGLDLLNGNFIQEVKKKLAQNMIQSKYYLFEITETSFVDFSREQIKLSFDKLAQSGGQIAIDDFGTGFNTLSYLNFTTINFLKIDKQFVQAEDFNLCSAISTIAKHRKISTVAEGIETQEQAQKVAACGIDFGQGYYFGKPEPPEVVESWLFTAPEFGTRDFDRNSSSHDMLC